MHTPPALYFLHWKFLTPFISLQHTGQTQTSPFITTLMLSLFLSKMLSLFLSNAQDGLKIDFFFVSLQHIGRTEENKSGYKIDFFFISLQHTGRTEENKSGYKINFFFISLQRTGRTAGGAAAWSGPGASE